MPGERRGLRRTSGDNGLTMVARLVIWRHPRPATHRTAGRCIGRTDVPADPRKARRLARRIACWARRHQWPDRTIWTSPLARATIVGRLLRRQGWRHCRDPRLAEVDFGRWDGRCWNDIAEAEIDAWRRDLLHHRPGDGEAVIALAMRVRGYCDDRQQHGGGALVVGHGGWIRLARALAEREPIDARNWGQRLIAHGRSVELDPAAIASASDSDLSHGGSSCSSSSHGGDSHGGDFQGGLSNPPIIPTAPFSNDRLSRTDDER